MRGAYDIVVQNARVQFKLRLSRNITVIRGNSATGKTTLIDMIAEHEASGEDSGVSISSERPCVVLGGTAWEERLARVSGSFVFIDEGNGFVRSHDFARRIRKTDNYYVLASRESLPALPYSVEEVYELRNTTSRYPGVRKFYTRTKRMYGRIPLIADPETVIVEDSNAGYEFYRALCEGSGIRCLSAHGKARMFDVLRTCDAGAKVLAIADGAAFGPEMELVYALANRRGYGLFLPESFGWVVLKSGLVKDAEVASVLSDPASYIESREYFSWERFFTDLIRQVTAGTYLRYDKAKLNDAYLGEREQRAIVAALAEAGLPATTWHNAES